MDKKSTIDLKEAAVFLGFKGTYHLREKARHGEIPGAFKISNKWMFLLDDLINLARNFSKDLKDKNEIIGKRKEWQSEKLKTVRTTIRASQSTELECKNLREQLLAEQRRNTKTSDEKI